MLFFHKNKRHFAYRSQRRVFVALFLFGFLATSIIALIAKVNAETVPVASVDFFSQNSNFNNIEPGAWKVTKSAEWIDEGKARITFDVVSRNQISQRAKDIVLVTEDSWSMEGWKIDTVKYDATSFVDDILTGTDNAIALITFDETATLLSNFSDDVLGLKTKINGITVQGCTSFYRALLKVEELFDTHNFQADRDTIVIFLADGSPCMDTPNEVSTYWSIKAKYPNVVFNGIQYEMDNEISQTLINITDYQFAADSSSLGGVLSEAAVVPKYYDDFVLTDYIEDEYWTISSADAISTTLGTTSLSYEDETPVVTWDLSGVYRLGGRASISIDVDLKDAYLNATDLLLPTNEKTTITSSAEGISDENVTGNATPKLKDVYSVSYEYNSPSNCVVSGTKPETQNYSIYSTVELSQDELTCDGYNFQGWKFVTNGVKRINEDYFRMPASDVVLAAVWGKPSITKTLDGVVNSRAEAKFDTGPTVNIKIRNLSGETNASLDFQTFNETITNIVRATTIPSTVDTNDARHILSTEDSVVPIYGWFNDGVLYYYTDADDIYLNEDASFMFFALGELTNINELRAFNASKVENMTGMFSTNKFKSTNLNAIKDWDVSNVTNMSGLFSIGESNIESFDAIKDWDVSNVVDMTGTFTGDLHLKDLKAFASWETGNVQYLYNTFANQKELISLEGLENWDVRNVVTMNSLFANSADNLHDVDPLLEWKTDNLTDAAWMFYSGNGWETEESTEDYGFVNVDGLRKWKMDKVTTIDGMFAGMNNLSDLSGLAGWNTGSVVSMENLFFNDSNFADIDDLADWDVRKVENMCQSFWGTGITNLNGASEWETESLTDTSYMFSTADKLADVSGAGNWDMSKVTDTRVMFYGTKALKSIAALKDWRLPEVTITTNMFAYSGITDLGDPELRTGATDWGLGKAQTMNSMFNHAASLTNIDGAKYWNTSSATSMSYMFYYDAELKNVDGAANWNTSNVTMMNGMFSYAEKLENINGLAGWDTSKVTTMNSMFDDTYQLTSLAPLAGWDVRKVEDMGWMFDTASKVTSVLPLANWKTYSLTSMANMFSSMSRLQSLDGLQNWDVSHVTNMFCAFDWTRLVQNVDEISGWDVSSVTNMSNMFRSSGIKNVDGMLNWHPNSVTTIAYIFGGADKLTSISGLSGWFNTDETSKITTMEYAFQGTKITDLNALATWKTPNLTNMRYAFSDITTLTNVDGLENWNTAKVTNVSNLFAGDTEITAENAFSKLNGWDTTKLTNTTDAFLNVPDTAIRPTWYVEPEPEPEP